MRLLHLSMCILAAAAAAAQTPSPQATPATKTAKNAPPSHQDPGERVFNANCSRCHTAPDQLPPRITGTVVRHMRVRASLSADDEKALLHYLAP